MAPAFLRSPYSLVFAATYAAWAVPELVDSIRDDGRDDAVTADRRSTVAIYAAVAALVGGGFFFALVAPWAGFGAATVPLFWLGVLLALGGTAVRWYAVRTLGRAFSRDVSVGADQDVVAAGPYAYVRHPTYAGSLATLVGIGLAFGTLFSLAVAVLAGGAAYAYRIRVEERALRDHLDGYAAYCEAVPYRLLPYVY